MNINKVVVLQDKEIVDDMEAGSKLSSIKQKAYSSDSADELDVNFDEVFNNVIKGRKKPAKKKRDDSSELL